MQSIHYNFALVLDIRIRGRTRTCTVVLKARRLSASCLNVTSETEYARHTWGLKCLSNAFEGISARTYGTKLH